MLPSNWRVILLKSRSKHPEPRNGSHWIASSQGEIDDWLIHDGNIGVCAGPVAILDFDKPGAFVEMCLELGALQQWVETGSGKAHCYVAPVEGLPAKLKWQGEIVGEIQRLTTQYVVAPPSIHPNGKPYLWLVDPRETPLPALPEAWLAYLISEDIPGYINQGDTRGHPEGDDEASNFPPADEIIRRALALPGARSRGGGEVKFQCPGCAREGHDNSRDNARVFADGRWGCAISREHTKDIGWALGLGIPPTNAAKKDEEIPTTDAGLAIEDPPLSDAPK